MVVLVGCVQRWGGWVLVVVVLDVCSSGVGGY